MMIPFMVLISGCGFHLRGYVDIPAALNDIELIIENANHDLLGLIRAQLLTYKIKVVSDHTQANYLLIVEKDDVLQQITNVSASTTTRQYELTYIVHFSLVNSKGTIIIPSTPVSVTRRFIMNSNRVLGSNWVEMLLKTEMRRNAAEQIIYKMSRMAKI